jgi:hypothetical protein
MRTVYKSGSAGHATKRLAYITGHTPAPLDYTTRQLRYLTQVREDLVQAGTGNLPAWAPDAHTYFSAAERYEGGGEQRQYNAFEEFKIALPHELSRAQNAAVVADLLATIAGDALPYTYAWHAPGSLSGSHEQPHIHLLISARRTDGYVRTPAQHFKRHNRKAPGQSGALKDLAFRHLGAVKAHRVLVSDVLNVHLERAGLAVRVHPDTLKSRGIDRKPEPKLLPSESHAYRTQGRVSATMAAVLGSRQARVAQRPLEDANARAYWETRKGVLGLKPGMSHERTVAQILLKRHGTLEGVPVRYQAALRRDRRGPDVAAQLQRLTRQWQAGREQEGHGDVRVRLTTERERGLGW